VHVLQCLELGIKKQVSLILSAILFMISTHNYTGELYAIKMFNVFDRERRNQLQKEIKMLFRMQCDTLISFYGAFRKDAYVGVILEYMDRGSLEFLRNKDCDVTEEAMAGIFYQIMWGLAYLHFEYNIHRDIKPGNVLINSMGAVKLSDFGISRSLDATEALTASSVGTFKYMSIQR
jgi:serine/threonine protein kinase